MRQLDSMPFGDRASVHGCGRVCRPVRRLVCRHVCVGMCVGMCVDMCVDMYSREPGTDADGLAS